MLKNKLMFRFTAVMVLVSMLLSMACITGVSFAASNGAIEIDPDSISGPAVDNPGEGIDKLFDGNDGTKLCTTFTSPFIITFSLKNAAVVNTYRIVSGGDAEERDPKDWNFYGSVDGGEWVLLDSRTDVDLPDRSAVYTFEFENEVEYKNYKLEILANNGLDAWGGDRIQFAEFKLSYTAAPIDESKYTQVEVNTDTVKGSANLDGDQGILQAFDGNVDTKVCIPHVSSLWVSAQLTNSAAVSMYKIASANDHDPRDPRDWTLYGSNDGVEWVALDVRENEDMPERNTYYTYVFENTTEYSYYKLDITSNNGADAVGLQVVQFSELQLFATEIGAPVVPEAPETNEPTEEPADPFAVDPSTITGSEVDNSYEGLDKLFDGYVDTKLCTSYAGSVVVSFALKNPAVVNTYRIGSAADAPERDPKSWKFYGSVDGSDWVLLDTKTNADLIDRKTIYTYTFDNETAYTYFKLEVTENNGIDPWGFDLIQFSELQVGYTEPGDIVIDPVKVDFDTTTVQGSADLEGSQGILQIFDENVGTKVCIPNVSSLWVSAKLVSPAAVCMYRIASANDHDPRDPRDWTLYGSNDGVEWVALDVRENEDMPERNTYYVYTFENTTEYSYYKLDITSNNGADAVGLQVVQFSEWQLFALPTEEEPEEPEEPTVGFVSEADGTRYYYEDGTYAKGWATIEGKTYRFDPTTGVLFTDPILYATNNYYFNPDHSTVEGFVEEDGGLRFYKKGVRQYGWADTNGDGANDTYFYVSSQLRCEEDRVLFDGVATRRFFKYDAETGFMEVVNGFYTNENGTQFFKNGLGQYGWITADGVSITDKPGITLSNVHYFAYGDGLNFYMVEDATKTIGGVVREFDENHLAKAYTGWSLNKVTGSSQYYIDGVMQQGWVELENGWIYLSRSQNLDNNIDYGDAFYGWKKIGGKVYYFRAGTSENGFTLVTDAERALNYEGVRDTYYINQPADAETATGADYFITNPPAGF